MQMRESLSRTPNGSLPHKRQEPFKRNPEVHRNGTRNRNPQPEAQPSPKPPSVQPLRSCTPCPWPAPTARCGPAATT